MTTLPPIIAAIVLLFASSASFSAYAGLPGVSGAISPDWDWGWLLLALAAAGWLLFWLFAWRGQAATSGRVSAPRPVSPAAFDGNARRAAGSEPGKSGRDSSFWTPLDQSTTVTVEELDDVEEEAEVFLLLGRLDMAIGVLRHHLEADADAPAHVWMTLLDVLHSQGLRLEFEKLAAKIQEKFNVALPSWEDANKRSGELSGLEHFPHLLDKIVAHWHDPHCLDFLHTLVQKDRKGERNGFHQEAFRDVLLLIAMLDYKANFPA